MRRIVCTMAMGLASLLTAPAIGAELEHAVRQLVRGANLGETTVTVYVMDLDRRQVLADIGGNDPMIPASNMKLLTTAAALDQLGPEFMFRTTLGLVDPADQEPEPVLGGALGRADERPDAAPSLYVFGEGDPAFGDPVLLNQHGYTVEDLLAQWVRAVLDTGIDRFASLLVDDRVFDRRLVHPDWPGNQLHKDYCAQVAGLNFHRNVVDVLPIPTAAGQAPRIVIYPEAPFLETVNNAVTGREDLFTLDRRSGEPTLLFGGSVRHRRQTPFQVTVHDPPVFFGRLLAHRLREAGVAVERVERLAERAPTPTYRPLHVVQTTLPLILARTNQDSENLFAEALFKRLGFEATGTRGGWANGAAAVRLFLQRRLGTHGAAAHIADGSGMSRSNRVSARLFVELLDAMHRDRRLGPLFRQSLSEGGINGTLAQRFRGLRGKVYGKSGYLSGVSSLSGYLVLPAGHDSLHDAHASRTIAFSVLCNGFKPPRGNRHMKALQDSVVALIERAMTGP